LTELFGEGSKFQDMFEAMKEFSDLKVNHVGELGKKLVKVKAKLDQSVDHLPG